MKRQPNRMTMKPGAATEPDRKNRKTVPNGISLFRIAAAPFLVWAGWTERPLFFLTVFALLLLSDFADGLLARWFHQRTRIGSQLDTAGDVLTSICAIAGAVLLWSGRLAAEFLFFGAVLLLLAVSGGFCAARFGRLPAYHTWSAKLSTAAAGVGAWLLFADITPWVFRAAVAVLAFSAVEAILITRTLPEWRPDVPTWLHALRMRRRARQAEAHP